MKNFYYQDGCLSQEDMRLYKTRKQHFATRRLVHKHIHACEICQYLYKQTSSGSIFRRMFVFLAKLQEILMLPFYYMRRSTIVYGSIILCSIILTPILLNVAFKKSGLTIKKEIKEAAYNNDSKPIALK